MKLIRQSPLLGLTGMNQDLAKLIEHGWGLLPSFTESSTMDLYEEDGNVVAKVSLPNFKKDEIEVIADGGILEVSAEHKEDEENAGKRRYYFRETSNSYYRRVMLPGGVKADKANASFKDGVLKVTMPMTAPKKARAVAVK